MPDDGRRRRIRIRPGAESVRLLLVALAASIVVPLTLLPVADRQAASDPVPPTSTTPPGPPPPTPGSPYFSDLQPPPASAPPPGAVPAAPVAPPSDTPRADLAIAARADPVVTAAGRPVTYTLTVTSKGPATAGRTTVVDTLPPGFVYRSSTAPEGTACTAAGAAVTCLGPGLPPGTARSIAITAQAPLRSAADAAPTTARVLSDLPDPTPGDDVASPVGRLARGADLVVTAPSPAGPVLAGTRAGLGAEVTNRGPSSAEGVVLTTALPPGATFVSGSVTGGGGCSAAGRAVTCPVPGTLAPAGTASASMVVAVDPRATGALVHDVTATSTTPGLRDAGDAAGRVSVVPRADVAVTVTGPPSLGAGVPGTWAAVVTNRGPSAARDVALVTDPGRGAVVGVSADATAGPCAAVGGGARCALGVLGPGESARVRITGGTRPDAPAGSSPMTTRVTTSTAQTSTANDTAPVVTTITPTADLAVALGTSDSGGALGSSAPTITLAARNLGPAVATGAVLSAVVPPGLTATAVSAPCRLDGQRVECPFGPIAPHTAATASVTTGAAPGLVSGGPGQVDASVVSAADPQPANDAASATVGDRRRAADVSVVAAGADRGGAGVGPRRMPRLGNAAPATPPDVVLSDALGAGIVPTTVPAGCVATGGGYSCGLGALAVGAERQVVLTARVDPAHAAGPVVNTATVRTTGDPSTSDDTATSATDVTAGADLRTELVRAGGGPIVAGGPAPSYRLRATNAGPSTATDTVLELDTPPRGFPVLGATVVEAAGAGAPCGVHGSRVVCPVAALPAGATAEALVTLGVAPDAPPDAAPLAASATSMVADPTPRDARATLAIPATAAADLRTRIELPADTTDSSPPTGPPTRYRVVVSDAGPSSAARTTFAVTLPPGTTALTASPSLGRCTARGARVDCAAGDLGVGGEAAVDLGIALAPGVRGPFAVSATASSATPDPTPAAPTVLTVGPGGVPERTVAGELPLPVPAPAGGPEPAGAVAATEADRYTPLGGWGPLRVSDILALLLAGAMVPTAAGALVLAWRRRPRPGPVGEPGSDDPAADAVRGRDIERFGTSARPPSGRSSMIVGRVDHDVRPLEASERSGPGLR